MMFQVKKVSLWVMVNVTRSCGCAQLWRGVRCRSVCVNCRLKVLRGQEWLHHFRHLACPARQLCLSVCLTPAAVRSYWEQLLQWLDTWGDQHQCRLDTSERNSTENGSKHLWGKEGLVGCEQSFESLWFRSVWTGTGLVFVHKDVLELLLLSLLIESPAQADKAVTPFWQHTRLTHSSASSSLREPAGQVLSHSKHFPSIKHLTSDCANPMWGLSTEKGGKRFCETSVWNMCMLDFSQ